jgi:hypothetical protein
MRDACGMRLVRGGRLNESIFCADIIFGLVPLSDCGELTFFGFFAVFETTTGVL